MRNFLATLAALVVLAFAVNAQAAPIVIDFEDLSGSSMLPSNYKGLTWDSNWNYYGWAQPPYDPSSGTQRIYTHNYGGWIDFGQDVTFLGSWVASYDVGQEMYWEGYDNGVKVYESDHLLGGAQSYLNVNWANVDYVKFVSTSFNHFIIDDLKYDTAPVPEPSTVLLLGAGLAGLGFLRRRARNQ